MKHSKIALNRLFDIILAVALILLFAIPMIVIALLIRLCMGSPVLFRQQRPGLHGKLFTLYKFRSMVELQGSGVRSDSQRLTKLGYWLRRSSLDELPQLFNVLLGHMRFVGPRPLLVEYLPLYTSEQAKRHNVKPGITGWAQINGRNALSWDKKFLLDIWYAENQSFWLDLKILGLTIYKIICLRENSQAETAIIEKFTITKNKV